MPWSETILEQFQFVDRSTMDENEYYGPYNTLLTDLFPPVEHFQVAPQIMAPSIPDSVDSTVIYIVTKRKVPVFFIEIRPYFHLQRPGLRRSSDKHMRRTFRDLVLGILPIPKLYGVSAMGTCLSIYECTKATGVLLPPAITPDPKFIDVDVYPQERWNYDLLEASGEEKLREIVAEVKAMAHNIAN
ncbi:hypothetical protein BJY52DRAFT_547743 [Lactarius psammicola]|nr:hypothetical protein BJY52DRAFT_547743 [Lactarius psammicola]